MSKSIIGNLLIIAALLCIAARFYFKHQGETDTADRCTIAGFALMAASGVAAKLAR